MRRGPSSATWTARSASCRSAPPSSTAPTCRPAPTRSSPPPSANGSPSAPARRCCPPYPIACSYGHGTELPGTLSLTPELLAAVARQYAEWAAARRGSPGCCSSTPTSGTPPPSASPPTTCACTVPTCRSASSTGGSVTPDVAAEMTVDGDDVHAHRAETSMMLAIAPELVHLDRLADVRRPRSHRRARVPLHRAGPVDQRRHRQPVGGHPRARRAAARAGRHRHRRPGRARPARGSRPSGAGPHPAALPEGASHGHRQPLDPEHVALAEQLAADGRGVRHRRLRSTSPGAASRRSSRSPTCPTCWPARSATRRAAWATSGG